nr:RNA-directed DNA polymerase, eukaryota [Tanacetum cinerariifolium]
MVYASEDESVHSPKKIPAHSPFSEVVSGDDSESDVEEVSETIFGDNSSSPNNNSDDMGKKHSEDPFKIYDILKKQTVGETREVSSSLSHPPGFTPEVFEIRKENDQGAEEFSSLVNAKVMNNSQEVYQEINRESVDSNVFKEGGSVLRVLEDIIRVGQAMGEAVGNLGGILCVWEANVFKKDYAMISDNFVAIYGTWLPSNSKILFVAIYAPQQASCKRMLWEYVSTLIGRWNGETIILDDFNEVRSIDERRGSCFNPSGARVFDHFISSSVLVDVKLERISRLLFNVGSRIRECIEGDENSKFFHGIINKKRSQLAIRGVFYNGLWCTNQDKVKEAFFNDFEARFNKPVAHRFMLNFPFNKRLSDMQAADLERNVSRDEIRLAVWNCGENKSLGLDGYTFEFFRKYWNIVGPDFCEAVVYFSETGLFFKGCNSSFVALIPKVADAKFVNDFRPISLIGSVYKVVTKILANRLALVIADLVSDTQSVFVANRQILDGPFILNEILHWCKRKKKQAMVEINIHKSQVLGVGIPRSIVMQAVSSIVKKITWAAWDKILASKKNGGLGVSSFHALNRVLLLKWVWRFISQDDSLWSALSKRCTDLLLFLIRLIYRPIELDKEVLVADKMKAVVGHSFRRPVRAGSKHQQMVDLNSLLESVFLSQSHDRWFCDLTGDGEFRVKEPRSLFAGYVDGGSWIGVDEGLFKGVHLQGSISISHLFYADDAMVEINIHKSQMLGVGIPRSIVMQAASSIGCGVMHNQFRYLGVMVKTLSIGGISTLLKSVLSASPLYNMSIFKVPKGILKSMEAIRCNFFNEIDSTVKKITWAAWDKILASKKNGDLGVSSFHALNRALLLKWVWRFISQDGSLWFCVIQALYRPSIVSHPVNLSFNWCSIVRELHLLTDKGFDFLSHCKKRIGDGNETRFWYDK